MCVFQGRAGDLHPLVHCFTAQISQNTGGWSSKNSGFESLSVASQITHQQVFGIRTRVSAQNQALLQAMNIPQAVS